MNEDEEKYEDSFEEYEIILKEKIKKTEEGLKFLKKEVRSLLQKIPKSERDQFKF